MDNESINVIFNYNDEITLIQSEKYDTVKNIIQLFCFKVEADINEIEFIYDDFPLDLEKLDKKVSELNIDETNTIIINAHKKEKENFINDYNYFENFNESNKKKRKR